MRSVLRLVLIALVTVLGWLQPAALADATAPSRVMVIQGYDASQNVDALNEVAVERGPPAAQDRDTDYDADGEPPVGASTRHNQAVIRATYDYDTLALLVQTMHGSDVVEEQVGGLAPASVDARRSGVAANSGIRALPSGPKIAAEWGADTYRHGGLMSTIEHINYRHAYGSGFSGVSRYGICQGE